MEIQRFFGRTKEKNEALIRKELEEARKNGIKNIKYHFYEFDFRGTRQRDDEIRNEYLGEKTLKIDQVSGQGVTGIDGSSSYPNIMPVTDSQLFLVPDFTTLNQIPWLKNTMRVICSVYRPPTEKGGKITPFEFCPHNILDGVCRKADEKIMGAINSLEMEKIRYYFAPELEFFMLPKTYAYEKIHMDNTLTNTNYCKPLPPEIDDVFQAIAEYMEKFGLIKEMCHSEVATFQYEIGLAHDDVMKAADNMMTLKYIVKNVAAMHGFRVTFIPKCNERVNGSGEHMHINIAISTPGGGEINLFYDPNDPDCFSKIGKNYAAGKLKATREITAFTNPLPISYKRLVPGKESPTIVVDDWGNRTVSNRGVDKWKKSVRRETRFPDPMCNQHIAMAALLAAGVNGIEHKLELPPPQKKNYYYDNAGLERLPGNLFEALECMKSSKLLKKWLGPNIVSKRYELGMAEWIRYSSKISDVDISLYS